MYQLDFEVNEAAMSALDRIKDRNGVQELTESINKAEKKSQISRERDMLEEFSIEALSTKLKADKYIYDIVLDKVEESEDVNELINSMISNMTKVYETLNVAPLLYKLTVIELENNSELENTDKAKILVESFMADNLFKLSKEKREKRYKSRVTIQAHEFVEAFKADSSNAVDYAYKSAVISDFLESLHFPRFAKIYLEECLSSELYAEFFETDVLVDAYHDYHETLKTVSQLIATTI